MEQQKKANAKINLKDVVDKITDKKNWKQRWSKIKTFIATNQKALSQKLGAANLEDYYTNEKNQIFNLILALYAGEDENEIFRDLDVIYSKYPREFEFYIPQLCTYLFHFGIQKKDELQNNEVAISLSERDKITFINSQAQPEEVEEA